MKELWEKSQKDEARKKEVKAKLEDENVSLKIKFEKMERE